MGMGMIVTVGSNSSLGEPEVWEKGERKMLGHIRGTQALSVAYFKARNMNNKIYKHFWSIGLEFFSVFVFFIFCFYVFLYFVFCLFASFRIFVQISNIKMV